MALTTNTGRGMHDLIKRVHHKLFNEMLSGKIGGVTVTIETALLESLIMEGSEPEGKLVADCEWHRNRDTRDMPEKKNFMAATRGKGGELCPL